MNPLWTKLTGCALLVLLGGAEPASAAWNNVFQVTLFNRHRRPRAAIAQYHAPVVVQSSPVATAAPDPCNPCPQQQCTTRYVQRCYYQPVTTYKTQTYYQPVTTYRTSYYYEPVTSYSYSCYYDPCTCSYRRVAVPTTSYRLRSQVCPVKSWVQRCAQVPVTSYKRCCYWQPQTTCCTTTEGAPVATLPPGAVQPPPRVREDRSFKVPIEPKKQESGGPPQGSGTKNSDSYRQPPFGSSGNGARPEQKRPRVKLDRIVSNSGTVIQGKVVQDDNAPRSGASLLFVNIDRKYGKRAATASANGGFNVNLASGRWEVYLRNSDGKQTYHSRIDVRDRQMPFITLVSHRK